MFVCSLHFTPSDFTATRTYEQGKTLLLKSGAVPTKKVPQPLSSLEPLQQSLTTKAGWLISNIRRLSRVYGNLQMSLETNWKKILQ